MTWQHFLRALSVAVLGASVLALASQARAEGGEASSLVPPHEVQPEAVADALGAEDKVAVDQEEADSAQPRRVASDKKSKDARALEASSPQKGAEDAESVPVERTGKSARSQQIDAVRSLAIKPLIVRHASENGVPYELADAVVRVESRYNPAARNGPHMGLTQINVQTAQSLGYQGPAAGLLDAETNLRYGLKYLAQAYRLAGGDVCGTILRYQAGHRTQTMTAAARAYCARVKVITASAE